MVQLIPKSTVLPMVTGLLEIIRRCIWNFLRVEKEHVLNTNSFTVIKERPDDVMKRIQKVPNIHRKSSF